MIEENSSNIALDEIEERKTVPSPQNESVSPTPSIAHRSLINSLAKLPPRSSAPVKPRMKDINLLLYKPHEISRIRVDRKKFILDKEFNNRVKQEQFHELCEKDLALRYSKYSNP